MTIRQAARPKLIERPGDRLPFARISTERLTPDRAFDAWCRSVRTFEIELGVPVRDFRIDTSGWMLGPFILTIGRMIEMRTVRSVPLLADRYCDMLFVLVGEGFLSGRATGRRIGIGPGEWAVLDSRQPFEIEAKDCAYTMLLVPRESLYAVPDARLTDLHGHRPDGCCATFLAEHARALVRHLPHMTAAEARTAAQSTLKLVEGVCLDGADGPNEGVSPVSSLRRRVERYIDNHLGTADLSPERIAADLEISRTTLYRAFQPSGGVAQHIRTRRLDTARGLLDHPEEHRSLGEIAELLGFATAASFAKAFRGRFGMPPRAVRGIAAPTTVPNSRALFEHWTRSIASFADPS